MESYLVFGIILPRFRFSFSWAQATRMPHRLKRVFQLFYQSFDIKDLWRSLFTIKHIPHRWPNNLRCRKNWLLWTSFMKKTFSTDKLTKLSLQIFNFIFPKYWYRSNFSGWLGLLTTHSNNFKCCTTKTSCQGRENSKSLERFFINVIIHLYSRN